MEQVQWCLVRSMYPEQHIRWIWRFCWSKSDTLYIITVAKNRMDLLNSFSWHTHSMVLEETMQSAFSKIDTSYVCLSVLDQAQKTANFVQIPTFYHSEIQLDFLFRIINNNWTVSIPYSYYRVSSKQGNRPFIWLTATYNSCEHEENRIVCIICDTRRSEINPQPPRSMVSCRWQNVRLNTCSVTWAAQPLHTFRANVFYSF